MANLDSVICDICEEEYYSECPQCPHCITHTSDLFIIDALYDGDINPLLEAIKKGELDFFGNVASVNYRDPFGKTSISIAASAGNLVLFKTLIEMGADVNITDAEGYDPLMFAASEGKYDVFEELVYRGANTDHVTNHGRSWKTVLLDIDKKEELEEFIQNVSYVKPVKKQI